MSHGVRPLRFEPMDGKLSKDDLRREARRLGMKTLLEAGFFKMLRGETTLAEILRVTKEK